MNLKVSELLPGTRVAHVVLVSRRRRECVGATSRPRWALAPPAPVSATKTRNDPGPLYTINETALFLNAYNSDPERPRPRRAVRHVAPPRVGTAHSLGFLVKKLVNLGILLVFTFFNFYLAPGVSPIVRQRQSIGGHIPRHRDYLVRCPCVSRPASSPPPTRRPSGHWIYWRRCARRRTRSRLAPRGGPLAPRNYG